jgi:EAL domain-containing protein (putative c-di-GMP-specific phosphodiesterase class I)
MNANFVHWLATQCVSSPGSSKPERESRIPFVLRSGDLSVVYQPIIDFDAGTTFAYEALVRSTSPDFQGPPALFVDAIQASVCGALGRVIRELAVDGCPGYPLFLNIHPNEFGEGWLVQPDDPIFRHEPGVFLEITESVPLSHFEFCRSVLGEIRSKGVYLAVDDLGAGYSNLKYIADLAPDIVKLDRALVANLHKDRRLRQLVVALVALCKELGAEVVAEGIETFEELNAVRDAGARFGQGFVLAVPAAPPPRFDGTALASIRESGADLQMSVRVPPKNEQKCDSKRRCDLLRRRSG